MGNRLRFDPPPCSGHQETDFHKTPFLEYIARLGKQVIIKVRGKPGTAVTDIADFSICGGR